MEVLQQRVAACRPFLDADALPAGDNIFLRDFFIIRTLKHWQYVQHRFVSEVRESGIMSIAVENLHSRAIERYAERREKRRRGLEGDATDREETWELDYDFTQPGMAVPYVIFASDRATTIVLDLSLIHI